MRKRAIRAAALLAAALLIPACGSSGGGAPIDNSLVAGDHFIVYFTGVAASHADISGTGTAAMDGTAGTVTLNTTENSGAPTTSPFNGVFSYTARTDGSLVISPPGQTISGGFDSLQELSVLSSITPLSPPLFMMTVRQNGTNVMTGDLMGDYFLLMFAVDPSTPSHRCETGTVNLTGAGVINVVSLTTNDEFGGISNTTTGMASYAVTAPDGTMTVTINSVDYNGGVLDGGNVAILGSVSGSSDPSILILVKKVAITYSDADLDGAYWLATFGWKASGPAHDAEIGTATFDGMGSVSVNLTDNEEGVIFTGSGGTAGYSVAADGTFTIDTGAGGDIFTGGVLQGGSIAVAASTSLNSDPEIIVAIKK